MAEIKSAIELAMEKTAGMTLTDEEKKKLDEQKERRAALGRVQRYFQGETTLKELKMEIEGGSEAFRDGLYRSLIDGIHLGKEEYAKALDALELFEKRDRNALKHLRTLSDKFGQVIQKKRRKLKPDLWKALADQGIEGPAVEPNVEASPQWPSVFRSVENEFKPRLEELKAAMTSR